MDGETRLPIPHAHHPGAVVFVDRLPVMTVGDINGTEKGTAARANGGKTRYDLLPLGLLKPVCDVLEYGERKYAKWNWTRGMNWSHCYASIMRHLEAWNRGEDLDSESGLPHLGHVMANIVFLTHYAEHYPEGDDRYVQKK